jgi:methylated-DNA-[protein]-cysteine S-methyltransferase
MKNHCYYLSPVGRLILQSENGVLVALSFDGDDLESRLHDSEEDEETAPLPEVIKQLDQYFAGERQDFEVPLRLTGTPFQNSAWQALTKIPYGATISYKEQATQLGTGPRAVGLANGQNPLAIILPCHRVIGADGSLVGYGGGLERKRALLALEADAVASRAAAREAK